MKVRFLSGPKTNTIEHLPPHICQPLIAAGIAEYIPLPIRGTPGWVEARIAESQELSGGRSAPGDTVVPFYSNPVWSVEQLPRGNAIIFLRQNSDVTRFNTAADAKAYGCPENIIEQLEAFNSAPDGAGAQALAQARAKQFTQDEADKVNRWRYLTARA